VRTTDLFMSSPESQNFGQRRDPYAAVRCVPRAVGLSTRQTQRERRVSVGKRPLSQDNGAFVGSLRLDQQESTGHAVHPVSISYGAFGSLRPNVKLARRYDYTGFNLLRSIRFIATQSLHQGGRSLPGFNLLRSIRFIATENFLSLATIQSRFNLLRSIRFIATAIVHVRLHHRVRVSISYGAFDSLRLPALRKDQISTVGFNLLRSKRFISTAEGRCPRGRSYDKIH
jgi:hypothetical protein